MIPQLSVFQYRSFYWQWKTNPLLYRPNRPKFFLFGVFHLGSVLSFFTYAFWTMDFFLGTFLVLDGLMFSSLWTRIVVVHVCPLLWRLRHSSILVQPKKYLSSEHGPDIWAFPLPKTHQTGLKMSMLTDFMLKKSSLTTMFKMCAYLMLNALKMASFHKL